VTSQITKGNVSTHERKMD